MSGVSRTSQLLEQITRAIECPVVLEQRRVLRTGRCDGWIRQQLVEQRRDPFARELRRRHPSGDAKTQQASRVVRLIEPHRHRQLRDARGKGLCQRADSAVMDERGASWEQPRERREAFVMHGRRERWQMLSVACQQKSPPVQPLTRVHGGAEE